MNQFDLKDAIDLFGKQTDTINGFWNLYTLIAFGVGTFVVGAGQVKTNFTIKFLLTVAFVVFAVTNCVSIHRADEILTAVANQIAQAATDTTIAPQFRKTLEGFKVFNVGTALGFHIILDVAVLAVIWKDTLHKWHQKLMGPASAW